eukprot:CAMPEP_0183323720 /NCGR_PEP_ID=MMETSP0160_2-20130417/75171_1 /TAXON_ID=2839 ORGANISM="Odontella Sinensis, Strain Grunow 1884" /NCGR_SAMPLE_ID=MMETSP0160_2 /ASSEMBLY_ACC=CAM_ASM_000250 /LENGTH=227 /DNA_ID=CAMNT_0025491145 /DNA_START=80 /DNA_END=763 /DNA_ORIENTATION=-
MSLPSPDSQASLLSPTSGRVDSNNSSINGASCTITNIHNSNNEGNLSILHIPDNVIPSHDIMRDAILPTEPSRPPVRFMPAPHSTYHIPSWRDMPPSEKSTLWNNEDDCRRFEIDIIQTIREFRTSGMIQADTDRLCQRGLEHLLSIDKVLERKGRMKRAVRAVLHEQQKQKAHMEGSKAERKSGEIMVEEGMLRTVSMRHTAWAMEVALAAAAMDQAYVYYEAGQD